MNKVLIIGNSGSGKSWLSARLSKALKIKEVNLDSIVWEPGGYSQKRPQDAIEGELSKLCLELTWVVEGVFGALAEKLTSSADTLIFLDIDWSVCENSLLSRGSESSKQLDIEQAEKNFRELLIWAGQYSIRTSKNSHHFHSKLYDEFNGNKFRFTSREEVNSFLYDFAKLPARKYQSML